MRSLGANLITAMEANSRKPAVRVSIFAGSTETFTNHEGSSRVVNVEVVEESLAGSCKIVIKDPQKLLKDKDYRGRRVQIQFGYRVNPQTPVEPDYLYSTLQNFWVIFDTKISEAGSYYTQLDCESIFERMKIEPAGSVSGLEPREAPSFNASIESGSYVASRTMPVRSIVTALCNHSRPPGFSSGVSLGGGSLVLGGVGSDQATTSGDRILVPGYDFVGAGVQVGDSVRVGTDITTFYTITGVSTGILTVEPNPTGSGPWSVWDTAFVSTPQPMLVYRWNTPLLEILQVAIDMTKTQLYATSQGISAKYVSATDARVDYAYGSGDNIEVFSALQQGEELRPNTVIVVDTEPPPGLNARDVINFNGSAQVSAAVGRYGQVVVMLGPSTAEQRIESNAEATTRAENVLNRIASEAASGIFVAPMHPGLELADRIQVVDSRDGKTFSGHVGRITWRLNLDPKLGNIAYEQEVQLGGLRKYIWSQFGNQAIGTPERDVFLEQRGPRASEGSDSIRAGVEVEGPPIYTLDRLLEYAPEYAGFETPRRDVAAQGPQSSVGIRVFTAPEQPRDFLASFTSRGRQFPVQSGSLETINPAFHSRLQQQANRGDFDELSLEEYFTRLGRGRGQQIQ